MALTAKTWKAVVTKKMLKSTEFKVLNQAVCGYLMNKVDKQKLAGAWGAWEAKLKKKGKDYKSSDRYATGCALDDLAVLVGVSASASPAASPAASTSKKTGAPRSHQQVVAARAAEDLKRGVRPGGNNYVKTSSGWKPKIFTQEETYSCTCACATTFLSKLIDTPVTEKSFKTKFNQVNGTSHNFSAGGTLWQPIVKTLREFGADASFKSTSTWQDLAGHLNKATPQKPVMLGVQWDNGGSPGGGHAIMCVGTGKIPGWAGGQTGYLIEDPWMTHDLPGLLDYGNSGYYWVWDKASAKASQAYVNSAWGCVIGKRSPHEFGKKMSHTKGVKLPGM